MRKEVGNNEDCVFAREARAVLAVLATEWEGVLVEEGGREMLIALRGGVERWSFFKNWSIEEFKFWEYCLAVKEGERMVSKDMPAEG